MHADINFLVPSKKIVTFNFKFFSKNQGTLKRFSLIGNQKYVDFEEQTKQHFKSQYNDQFVVEVPENHVQQKWQEIPKVHFGVLYPNEVCVDGAKVSVCSEYYYDFPDRRLLRKNMWVRRRNNIWSLKEISSQSLFSDKSYLLLYRELCSLKEAELYLKEKNILESDKQLESEIFMYATFIVAQYNWPEYGVCLDIVDFGSNGYFIVGTKSMNEIKLPESFKWSVTYNVYSMICKYLELTDKKLFSQIPDPKPKCDIECKNYSLGE